MASAAFKTAIKSDEREIKAYALVYYTGKDFDTTGLTSMATAADIVTTDQVFDTNGIVHNYASFESNYFKTDGSMVLPNNPTTPTAYENPLVGYISEDIVGDATFTTGIPNNNNDGFTIVFGGDDIPTAFSVSTFWFNGTDEDNETVNITNNDKKCVNVKYTDYSATNTLVSVSLSIEPENYNALHRVRIAGILPSVVGVYQNDELIEMNIDEQVDITNETTPSSDCSITLNNYDDKFDVLDTDSLAQYLIDGIQIKPYIGCVLADGYVEYVAMGIYYLSDWQNNSDSTTTINANDTLSYLSTIVNFGYRGTSIADFLDSIGVTNDVNITASTDISGSFAKEINALEFLQYLAMANNAYIYINRTGVVCVADIPTTAIDSYDIENFKEYPQIKINKEISNVEINYKIAAHTQAATTTIFNSSITHDASGTTKVIVYFEEPYVIFEDEPTEFYVSTGTIASAYTGFNVAEANVTSASDFTLTIKGYKIDQVIERTYKEAGTTADGDSIIIGMLGSEAYNIDTIAGNILDNDKRFTITAESQQDPSILAGQMITIETKTGTKDIIVTKNNFKYDGGLSGIIEGISD